MVTSACAPLNSIFNWKYPHQSYICMVKLTQAVGHIAWVYVYYVEFYSGVVLFFFIFRVRAMVRVRVSYRLRLGFRVRVRDR